MQNTKQSAVKTAKRYLELKGLEIVGENWSRDGLAGAIDLIASDCGEIVFATVSPAELGDDLGFREEPLSREQFELLAATWLDEHVEELENSDYPIRFDRISMLILSESRAVLRHHVNALTGPFACM